MSWNTKKLSDTAYFVEDHDTVPGGVLVIGSIFSLNGRWYVEIMQFGGDVKGDFEKYETALAFVDGVEKMQAIREKTGERPR